MSQGIERKKAFLKSYQRGKRALVSLELELEELENALPADGYDGLPRAHDPKDLSGKVARIVELKEKIRLEEEERVKTLGTVQAAISRLGPGYEREILTRRYITGQTWEQIEYEMGMTARNAQRYHGYALTQLAVPKGWKREERRRGQAVPGDPAAAGDPGDADRGLGYSSEAAAAGAGAAEEPAEEGGRG